MNLQDKIELALERGNVQGAKKLLDIHYKREDFIAWGETKREEYYSLFPIYREPTTEEMDAQLEAYREANPDDTATDGFIIKNSKIDYISIETVTDEDGNTFEREIRTPSNYLTYDEWLNENEPYTQLDTTDRVDAFITSRYKELRAKEYPSMTDYLDAVVKGDTEAQQDYIDACLAVKAKYPKPEVQDA